jgi:2-oxoglutarate ferredoxin oxidoreductase subunit delta
MNHDHLSDDNHKRAGESGLQSPSDQAEAPPSREYKINIYRDWCKSCGICVAFCPRQCLSLDAQGNPQVENSQRCTGCRWCELHCPDFAICIREVVENEKRAEEVD